MTVKHLVISGGGPIMVQVLGAIQHLEQNNFIDMKNIESIYGTSAGAIVGIETYKAVILAGTLGVATVVEKLARGFLDDGKLTVSEINAAFTAVDKKAAK